MERRDAATAGQEAGPVARPAHEQEQIARRRPDLLLLLLIDLLERATEPSQRLDIEITRVIEPTNPMFQRQPEGSRVEYGNGSETRWGWSVEWPSGSSMTWGFPKWTSSVDVALKLVPRHHLWELRQGFETRAIVWMIETDYDDRNPPTGYSTTYPALALCIAALKAEQEKRP